MRLAFIKKSFSVHGGAERYMQTMMAELKKRGHEIHVFANSWPSPSHDIIFHKVGMSSLNSFLSTVSFNRNAAKAIEGTVPDLRTEVVESGLSPRMFDRIVSFERTTCQDIYRAGEGCHAEWLEIRSGFEPFYKKLSFRMNPLHIALLGIEKELFARTGVIIANSEMVKKNIMKHYAVPEQKITIIYNGVDLARFSPANKKESGKSARKEIGLPEASRVLLFVGSGFRRKGLDTLINAISYLVHENISVVVIGKGDVGRYGALAGRLGVSDRLVFLGPRGGIEKFYSAADIFVLPTLYDPFSNATIEAMASGLPVITTKNNGVSELIDHGREGFVLEDMTDAEELAALIRLALDGAAVMGKLAREKTEKFPIENAAAKFVEVMEKSGRN